MKKKAMSLLAVLMLSFTFASVVGANSPSGPHHEHTGGGSSNTGSGGGGVGGPHYETP